MSISLSAQQVKEKIISALTEDDLNKQFITDLIEKLSSPSREGKFFSGLLELFIHISVNEEEAKDHWQKIFDNYEYMAARLDHDVGIRVAIMDYFVNLNKLLKQPILVEIRVFRETEKLAMLDGLTGLFNRRYFDINLLKELRRASRYDKDFSILMLDIDNFKDVNDTKGHLFGDEVLKNLATQLTDTSRGEDIICRYGGEEFIVILPETLAAGALKYADRLRSNMNNSNFFKKNKITFSGGIVSYPYGGKIAKELLENVDKALYEAKFSGKDCVIIAHTDKRRRERFKRNWKVFCQHMTRKKGTREVLETQTIDISFGGVCFELEKKFALETKLMVDIELPTGMATIAGKIVWAQKTANTYRYGVEFVDLKSEQLHKMMRLLPSDNFDPGESIAP